MTSPATGDTRVDTKMVRVGTRDSQLALKQTHLAIEMLQKNNPNIKFEVISMSTLGDKNLDVALSKIGDKSLFTKELEVALLANQVDFVVHSMKDMQTTLPESLVIGSVCARESLEDVVLMNPSRRGQTLADLPKGSVVGTSSVRRTAQLKRIYPGLEMRSVRGNLNTRLLKLDSPEEAVAQGKGDGQAYAGLVLAKAGVERMGWAERIDQVLDSTDSLYAVGQGALALQCRQSDAASLSLLASIHNEAAALTCIAERALMSRLEGGCSTPVAVRSHLATHPSMQLALVGGVFSLDGKECITAKLNRVLVGSDAKTGIVQQNSTGESNGSTEEEGSEKPIKRRKTGSFSESNGDGSTSQQPQMGIVVASSDPFIYERMIQAKKLGDDLAKQLLDMGADKILLDIKNGAGHS